ncbi:MAG: hypothetical protein O7E51_08255, partial [Acidobacteria bacterium]|nr:hypothetical protein [Acidobacteriota bacterium]
MQRRPLPVELFEDRAVPLGELDISLKDRNLPGGSGFRDYMEAVTAGSDAEVMLRVKGGDESSFAYLLTKHRDPVVNYLYRMVQNAAVAEELAQE